MSRPLALIVLIAAIAFAVAPFVTPPFTGYEPGQFPVDVPRRRSSRRVMLSRSGR